MDRIQFPLRNGHEKGAETLKADSVLRAVQLLQTDSLCTRNKGCQGYRKYKLDSDKETREGEAREKEKRKGPFRKQGETGRSLL